MNKWLQLLIEIVMGILGKLPTLINGDKSNEKTQDVKREVEAFIFKDSFANPQT